LESATGGATGSPICCLPKRSLSKIAMEAEPGIGKGKPQRFGPATWPRDFGPGIWPGDLARGFGPGIWPGDLAQGFGPGILGREAPASRRRRASAAITAQSSWRARRSSWACMDGDIGRQSARGMPGRARRSFCTRRARTIGICRCILVGFSSPSASPRAEGRTGVRSPRRDGGNPVGNPGGREAPETCGLRRQVVPHLGKAGVVIDKTRADRSPAPSRDASGARIPTARAFP
jgi:hypothetical protein